MNDHQLAQQQPADIHEALDCMQQTLELFHEEGDKRAFFLRLYYVMTREVHAAIKGLGEYSGRTVFLDPPWIERLSGKFASLYFRSLDGLDRNRGKNVERAWMLAHEAARGSGSTVVQNALLGINAHINYDLARAIATNFDPGDLADPATLARRKFDHDQVNNLLVRTLEPIQKILAHDYEPGIDFADRVLGKLDERLSETGLKYYRERVWTDAVAFAAAMKRGNADIVENKLDWESYKIALYINDKRVLWAAERLLGQRWRRPAKGWSTIELEGEGGVAVPHGRPVNPWH